MPFSPYVIKNSCLLVVTCSVEFLATQYTSMDWLMDCWSNGYLRNTRCKPSSKEPEVRLVTEWSVYTPSVTLGPTISQWLNASGHMSCSSPSIDKVGGLLIHLFVGQLLSSHCEPCIVLGSGLLEERIRSYHWGGFLWQDRGYHRLKCTYKCRVWFSSFGVGPGSLSTFLMSSQVIATLFGSNIATQVSSSDQEHASVGCQFRLLLLINPVEVAPSCYFAKIPRHTY